MWNGRLFVPKRLCRASWNWKPLLVVASIAAIIAGGVSGGCPDPPTSCAEEGNGLILEYMRVQRQPHAVRRPGRRGNLADDTPVIGVHAGGRRPGLRQSDLHPDRRTLPQRCPRRRGLHRRPLPPTGCTRVFVVPHRAAPLEIAVGGWLGRGEEPGPESVMLLRIGEAHYFHDTGEALQGQSAVPYPTADFEQTTGGNGGRPIPTRRRHRPAHGAVIGIGGPISIEASALRRIRGQYDCPWSVGREASLRNQPNRHMTTARRISVIDSHTGGEPTRVVDRRRAGPRPRAAGRAARGLPRAVRRVPLVRGQRAARLGRAGRGTAVRAARPGDARRA